MENSINSSITGSSQIETPIVKFLNPASVWPSKSYSHAVEIDLGNCKMIIISGQVPVDEEGKLVGKGDLAKQTQQVFLNVINILETAGGTIDNVVKTVIYMIDVNQFQIFRDIRNKFINAENAPTSTLVQVSKLFSDEWLIEIEATAIVPKR